MVHEEYSVALGERPLFAQAWSPEGGARAAVALVHGFGEHSGRYAEVGDRFAAAGCACAAVDLPGHGKTAGTRGVTSYAEIFDAVAAHLRETKRRYPGLPVFLYGHSLGGAVVLRFAIEEMPVLAGLIATSPLVGVATRVPGWKRLMAGLLRNLSPLLVMDNPLDLSALTRNQSVVDATRRDPLYHNKASVLLGADMLGGKAWFSSVQGAFPFPLLVMQGTADRIVDPAATVSLVRRLTGDVTLKVWEGFYHELHNEPEREQVLEYELSWIWEHV